MSTSVSPVALVLLGAGGHGRVLLDALRAAGAELRGLLDPAHRGGTLIEGVPVLGDDGWLEECEPQLLVNGVGANPSTVRRRAVFERWRGRGHRFASVVHPAAVVAESARLGEGVQVLARAVVQPGASLAENVVINTGAILEHDVEVAASAFVAPGAIVCGGVRLGEGAFVGAGAVIVPGVVVGAGAVLAAGATVVRDVAAGACVMGAPARPVAAKRQESR